MATYSRDEYIIRSATYHSLQRVEYLCNLKYDKRQVPSFNPDPPPPQNICEKHFFKFMKAVSPREFKLHHIFHSVSSFFPHVGIVKCAKNAGPK